jgi:uncharacterized protein
MEHFGLKQRELSTLLTIFEGHPRVTVVWIFGSRATHDARPGSDIDLAIMNEGVSEIEILRIASELEESDLPYFVDVVNYPALKHVELKDHIQRVGVCLFKRIGDELKVSKETACESIRMM